MPRLVATAACLVFACRAFAPAEAIAPKVTFPTLESGENTRVIELTSDMRTYVTGKSWRAGCPVGLQDLRVVVIRHVRLNGTEAQGALMVHKRHAKNVARVFNELYKAKFPIDRMQLVDDFEANDDTSTLANNTSAFNCRRTTGSKNWSQHAYGAAIDINPLQNPYVYRDGSVLDDNAVRYKDRSLTEPGMIHRGDAAVTAFRSIGWGWGGNFNTTKDYQHFSSNGR